MQARFTGVKNSYFTSGKQATFVVKRDISWLKKTGYYNTGEAYCGILAQTFQRIITRTWEKVQTLIISQIPSESFDVRQASS